MKLLFIVNPIAGSGSTLRALPLIEEYCQQRSVEYSIIKTKYKGHATELARDAISSPRFHGIIAVGGDGTVMEVANGLTGSSIPLGILPLGTGNDLAKALNIPIDIKKALYIVTNGRTKLIDTINYGNKYFFNVASVGFDAEIARDIEKMKRWISGKTAYYLSALLKFFTYRDKYVYLEIDGKEFETPILLLAIANGTHYGGGMYVNPMGSINDGYIDVILIKPVPRYLFPFLFPKFIKGQHLDLPYVATFRCKSINIKSNENLPVNGDGDIITTTPFRFSISDKPILVYY
jgi:YegS/Rv2252/BmrU family lipid kinase